MIRARERMSARWGFEDGDPFEFVIASVDEQHDQMVRLQCKVNLREKVTLLATSVLHILQWDRATGEFAEQEIDPTGDR